MKQIPWRPYGVPPKSDGDLTYCLVLHRSGDGVARLMLVRGLAPGVELYQPHGLAYLCCPVMRGINAHVDAPEIVPDSEIIARWATVVPRDIVAGKAFQCGVLLVWPDDEEIV